MGSTELWVLEYQCGGQVLTVSVDETDAINAVISARKVRVGEHWVGDHCYLQSVNRRSELIEKARLALTRPRADLGGWVKERK